MERISKRLKKDKFEIKKNAFFVKVNNGYKKLPNKIEIELSELMDQNRQIIYLI